MAEAELRRIVGDLGDVVITDCAPSGDVHLDHPLIRDWLAREALPSLSGCRTPWVKR